MIRSAAERGGRGGLTRKPNTIRGKTKLLTGPLNISYLGEFNQTRDVPYSSEPDVRVGLIINNFAFADIKEYRNN